MHNRARKTASKSSHCPRASQSGRCTCWPPQPPQQAQEALMYLKIDLLKYMNFDHSSAVQC